jgi:putative transposase
VHRPRQEKEVLKSRGLLRRGNQLDPVAVFEFIDREKSAYQVRFLCRTFKVSASGYYVWRTRPVCPRKKEDARLRELIVPIHARSPGTYGVPRIRAELHYDHGVRCSHKRVFRLMRLLGIQGKRKRRKFKATWRSLEAKPAPHLVERNFVATRSSQQWTVGPRVSVH